MYGCMYGYDAVLSMQTCGVHNRANLWRAQPSQVACTTEVLPRLLWVSSAPGCVVPKLNIVNFRNLALQDHHRGGENHVNNAGMGKTG